MHIMITVSEYSEYWSAVGRPYELRQRFFLSQGKITTQKWEHIMYRKERLSKSLLVMP